VLAWAGLTLMCCSLSPPPAAQNEVTALRDKCIAHDLVSCADLCREGDEAACSDYKVGLCGKGGTCLP
jgi:hypothetical protein